jgi:hypothetical protein
MALVYHGFSAFTSAETTEFSLYPVVYIVKYAKKNAIRPFWKRGKRNAGKDARRGGAGKP